MFKSSRLKIAAPILRFLRDREAATSIEYAIIASGIAVVLAATIVSLGSNVKGMFSSVSTSLN